MARPRQTDTEDSLPLFDWSPPTKIVPFPAFRRMDFVYRHARRMCELRPIKAEEHLDRMMGHLADRHTKNGVPGWMAEADIAAVRMAIMDRYRFLRSCEGGEQ